jgi:hypothetical protein
MSYKEFCDGRVSVNDFQRCRRPPTLIKDENIEPELNTVESGRQKSIQEITTKVEIFVLSVHNILHKDFNMHFLCQQQVPKTLTTNHKHELP